MRLAFITDPGITYYRRVLKGFALFGRSHPAVELRIESPQSPGDLAAIDRAGYDGLILGTTLENSVEATRLRTPAVSVSNTYPDLVVPRVVSDDGEAGRIVARHLLDKGYRHFAFWGDEVVFGQQRWSGFAATIQAVRGADFALARSAARGRDFTEWLRRLPRPLGLMAMNDAMAADAIEACRRLHLRIPEDVAVVGVDDDDLFSDLTNPPLSSVAQQTERIGSLAAECLVRLIEGERLGPVTLVPMGPLIARRSSQTVAAQDTLVVQAVQFMEQHLAEGVNVAELDRVLGVSRRSLELRFRTSLGRTPGRELARLKIERARSLLATTSLPLKQVASLSGFGNSVRMSQALRHYTGQTPMGYRRGFASQ